MIHAPQLVGHAAWLAEYVHESRGSGSRRNAASTRWRLRQSEEQHLRRHALEPGCLCSVRSCRGRRRPRRSSSRMSGLIDRLKLVVDRSHHELRRKQACVQVRNRMTPSWRTDFARDSRAAAVVGCAPSGLWLSPAGAPAVWTSNTRRSSRRPAVVQAVAVIDQTFMPGDLARASAAVIAVRRQRAPGMSQARGTCVR